MAITVNKNTTQAPMTTAGATGTQVQKFNVAPRVYVKALDSTPTPVRAKSNGATQGTWTDLGSVDGNAKITYAVDKKKVS